MGRPALDALDWVGGWSHRRARPLSQRLSLCRRASRIEAVRAGWRVHAGMCTAMVHVAPGSDRPLRAHSDVKVLNSSSMP